MYKPRRFKGSEGVLNPDLEPFPYGDVLHLFHIQTPPGQAIAHLISSDGLAWETLPDALYTGAAGEFDHRKISTVCVVERDGVFYMLYNAWANSLREETIGLATSHDMIHWEKVPDNPVAEVDPRWYHTGWDDGGRIHWRDPKVSRVGDCYYAVVCARQKDAPILHSGAVGLMSSLDMQYWEVELPLFAPCQYFNLEVPQVFKIGRYYYITASALADGSQRYWIAEDFRGPYRTPPNNRLAPPGHYGARVFHWKGYNSLLCWHWAERLWFDAEPDDRHIPAPLVLHQEADGRLICGSWPLWMNYQDGEARLLPEVEPLPLCGNPTASREGNTMQVEQGMEIWRLSKPIRDFVLEGDLAMQAACGGLAFALDDEATGYFVEFLRGEYRGRLVKWMLTQHDDGEADVIYQVVKEVPLALDKEKMHVRLLVVGWEAELSVDGRVVLSAMIRGRTWGEVGAFAVCGHVSLQNTSVTPMREPQHR